MNEVNDWSWTAHQNPGLRYKCDTCEAEANKPCTHTDGCVVSDTFVMHLDRYDRYRIDVQA